MGELWEMSGLGEPHESGFRAPCGQFVLEAASDGSLDPLGGADETRVFDVYAGSEELFVEGSLEQVVEDRVRKEAVPGVFESLFILMKEGVFDGFRGNL